MRLANRSHLHWLYFHETLSRHLLISLNRISLATQAMPKAQISAIAALFEARLKITIGSMAGDTTRGAAVDT